MEVKFIKKSERQSLLLEEINNSQDIITKKELAEKFCVTERTIIRDMKDINLVKNDIMTISGRNGGYKKIEKE